MKRILLLAAVLGGMFCPVNVSFAQTWVTNGAPPSIYDSIASSADGSKLIAGGTGVFISTNSGANWISNNLPAQSSVCISADGTKMTSISSLVLVSTNSGTTWNTNASAGAGSYSLASTADGSKLISLNNSRGGIVSTNYGLTWKSFTAPGNKVAMSADGTQSYFIIVSTTNIYASTNLGVTSTRIASPGIPLISLAVSADGKKLVAGTVSGPIYISTNYGKSWTPTITPSNPQWFYVASSADGSHLMGALRGSGINGPIYSSTDSGATWISNNIVINLWSGVASSADGGELLAVNPNYVYMSKFTVSPQINTSVAGTNLAFSWTVPSTNFVLQQSLDFTSWSAVTNAPVLNFTNLQYQVSLTPSDSSGFFRLISP